MDNVVKLGEVLGQRHKKAVEQAKEAASRRSTPQKMTSAEIKRFSRENNWVSYHDVITAEGYRPLMRRFAMNRELRVNYGRLVDQMRSYGFLKKKTEYGVSYHEEAQIFEIYEAFTGKSVILVKSSECSQVWDW